MPVIVAKASLVKLWRSDVTPVVGVRSKAPVEDLLRVVGDVIWRQNEVHSGEWMLSAPWPTPKGVAFYGECQSEEHLLAVVDKVATSLEADGVEARIGPLANQAYPWPDQWHDDGYCAAMTIIGQAHWDPSGGPGDRRLTQRMWDADPDALAAMIEYAVNWCRVDGGELWLESGITSFKIPVDLASRLLVRALASDPQTSIISAQSPALVRRVGFASNGFVSFELGGSDRPAWQDCVAELTSVLADASANIEWGFMLRRPCGVSGIGSRTTRVVHQALWEPYKDQVRSIGHSQDPRRYSELVLDVYGVQVLGPQHDTSAIADHWHQEDLGEGRTLVSAPDLSAWFPDAPTMETLLAARESFGHLVDPIWNPAIE